MHRPPALLPSPGLPLAARRRDEDGARSARRAPPLIASAVRQVERNETPTLGLGWLPNYFCAFSMSNWFLGGIIPETFPRRKPPSVPQAPPSWKEAFLPKRLGVDFG